MARVEQIVEWYEVRLIALNPLSKLPNAEPPYAPFQQPFENFVEMCFYDFRAWGGVSRCLEFLFQGTTLNPS